MVGMPTMRMIGRKAATAQAIWLLTIPAIARGVRPDEETVSGESLASIASNPCIL